jgi:hypothetical protein
MRHKDNFEQESWSGGGGQLDVPTYNFIMASN